VKNDIDLIEIRELIVKARDVDYFIIFQKIDIKSVL
jgi:hypothetical protein